MNSAAKTAEFHEDIESLLPWHAAGTLNARDAARVEQALAADSELARRFELVRDELNETIDLNETLGAPSARVRETLFAMIDAEPARQPKAAARVSGWLSGLMGSLSPRTLAYGATAAAFAILLQAGVLTGLLIQDQGQGPQLASYESEPAAPGSFVLLRFHPQATAGDITKFLYENGVTMVGGPAGGTGLFRVRVAETLLPQAELSAVAKKLGQDPSVAFLLPGSP